MNLLRSLKNFIRHNARCPFRDNYILNQQASTSQDDKNPKYSNCLVEFGWKTDDEREKDREGASQNHTAFKSSHLDVNNIESFLGVVGLGAAFIVGFQHLIKSVHRRHRNDSYNVYIPFGSDSLNEIFKKCCPTVTISRYAPKLCILPAKETSDSQQAVVSKSETVNYTQLYCGVRIPTPIELTQTEDKSNEANEHFDSSALELSNASRDFISAVDTCVGIIQNHVGNHLSAQNKPHQALRCFESGCQLGDNKACFNAGLCYHTGHGTERNIEKAKEFYHRAAAMGHAGAMYNLSVFYLDGESEMGREKGLGLMKSAAELGVIEAQRFLALYHLEIDEMDTAVTYLKAAVEKKDVESHYYLALCYEHGWGLDENLAKAADLYSHAASKGHKDAMFNLAVFHELGLGGLPSNRHTALELYSKAAEAGHSDAIERLAKSNYSEVIGDARALHNSSSLPDMSMLNGNSFNLAKSMSDNLIRLSKENLGLPKQDKQMFPIFGSHFNQENFTEYTLGNVMDIIPCQS